MHLKVAAINYPGVFSFRRENDSYIGVEGYEFDFLHVLSQALKFKYEIVAPPSNDWGIERNDGSWTGFVGAVHQGIADIVIEKMTVVHKTKNVLDYSFPYHFDKLTFAIPVAGEAAKDFAFLCPFKFSVWICIFFTIFVCLLVLGVYWKFYRKRLENKTTLLSIFEMLMGFRDSVSIKSKNTFFRIFFTFYLLAMCILMYSYKGSFLSFILKPVMDHQIDTLEDMVLAIKTGQVNAMTYEATYSWHFSSKKFEDAETPMAFLHQYWKDHPELLVKSSEEALPWVLRGYAFISTESYLNMRRYQTGTVEQIHMSSVGCYAIPMAVAIRKNFCCREEFNEMVYKIREAGIYDKIFRDNMFRLQLRGRSQKSKRGDHRALAITDVVGAFWIVLPFYLLSILVLCLEIFHLKLSLLYGRRSGKRSIE